jgi:hypothetical protein
MRGKLAQAKGKARKDFFFEKKKQKTFVNAVADLSGEHPTAHQSFLLLFFKKERFLP